jgi:hypothetical protein
MYLRAHGTVCHAAGELPADLKNLVAAAISQPVRRISRFMQLALIGAGRCARNEQLLPDTAVFLASDRGDVGIASEAMEQIYRHGQAPKPLTFVNTVSNSAAFYITKCLGLQARSSFVCRRYSALAAALNLALIDMQQGTIRAALVGVVDGAILPSAHEEFPLSMPLAESSEWLYFTSQADPQSPAHVADVCMASDREQLLAWIDSQPHAGNGWLAAGPYLSKDDTQMLQARAKLAAFGIRAVQPAAALIDFSRQHNHALLLHVDSDALGRYVGLSIRT